MHTLWLPYRDLDETNKSRHGFTSLSNTKERKRPVAVTEEGPLRKKFQFNRSTSASSNITESTISEENRPIAPDSENGKTNKVIHKIQPDCISQLNLPRSLKDRECSLVLTEEPQRKQVQPSRNVAASTRNEHIKSIVVKNDVKNTAGKQSQSKEMFTEERCITGDVSQITKLNKHFPDHNILYELYGKIYQISQSKCRAHDTVNHRTILLRNKTGPIIQGIFYEVDRKVPALKSGDSVRCVGKFVNSSQLHIFKIDVDNAQNRQFVDRLNSIGNFLLSQPNSSTR